MVNEYVMVSEQGFSYEGLGYKTIEGEVPAFKVLDHLLIGSLIQKHKPKPKKVTAGGKSYGTKRR